MLVRTDALDAAHRARAETRAGAVGDAEIHRHADESDVEPGKIRGLGGPAPIRRIEQRRDAAVRKLSPVGPREDERDDLLEFGIEHVAPLALGVFRAQHGAEHGSVGDAQFAHFFHPHVVLGDSLLIVGILVFLSALAGRLGRRWILPALALPVLVELQFVFANNGPPWFRALHVLNAFAIAGIAGSQTGLAWRNL